MIRVKFNVKDNVDVDVDVDVKWLWSDDDRHIFGVTWFENDTFRHAIYTQPFLEIREKGDFRMNKFILQQDVHQMTIADVIETLQELKNDHKIKCVAGIKDCGGSYRGYYHNFAVVPTDDVTDRFLIDEVINFFKQVVGTSYSGYKGGEYVMYEDTLVNVAYYGESGPMLVGFRIEGDTAVAVTNYEY